MSAHDFVLVAPLSLEEFRPKNISDARSVDKISPKAQSADTFREGSTGTCECTRLSFTGATKYFLREPAAITRRVVFASRRGKNFRFEIK
jgi:hypothetical protein